MQSVCILLQGADVKHTLKQASSYFALPISKHRAFPFTMQGVGDQQLLKEASSYDTIGNGYFAATIHAVPAGWR